jgi:transcriptional regulator
MYIPESFEWRDREEIVGLIRSNPFGIVVSTAPDGLPIATHIPLLLETSPEWRIAGHLAKANPHAERLKLNVPTLVIFPGPHTYVSPSLYQSQPNVPTWNYLAVHLYGTVRIVDESAAVVRHLSAMMQALDPDLEESNPETFDAEMLAHRARGIVAFELDVTRIDAKAKLSQNRSQADHEAVRLGLARSGRSDDLEISRVMDSRK